MITVVVLALALAADAFAAAVTQGAGARARPRVGLALIVGSAFGVAQAVMPLAGWALGVAFDRWMRDIDHWIAFVLLVVIGVKMLRESATSHADGAVAPSSAVGGWTLATTAFATSVDAAAAGVSLPLLGPPVLVSCAVIGAVTFLVSTAGVFIGAAAGSIVGRRAEAIGGVVLIGIGVKILVDHLFFGG
jgi:putative Mn2+ efflux pump MntP